MRKATTGDILERLRAWRKRMPAVWYGNADLEAAAAEIEKLRSVIAGAGGEPQAAPVQASEFWEALKRQCAATPDKSKVKALIQVRCEDVVAAWNSLALSRPERAEEPQISCGRRGGSCVCQQAAECFYGEPTEQRAQPQTASVWPAGCHDPGSCARHKACMYQQCKHEGAWIRGEIDPLAAGRRSE